MNKNKYLEKVERNAWSIETIPLNCLTEKICLAAISAEPSIFSCIDESFHTEAVVNAALNGYGGNLSELSIDNITQERCLIAVSGACPNGALAIVPKEMKTPELCLAAVLAYPASIRHVPSALVTGVMCLGIIKVKPLALEHIPKRRKTQALCEMAMRLNALAVKFAPESFQSSVRWMQAIELNGTAIKEVPNKFITRQMCEVASKKGCYLRDVPKRFRSMDICAVCFSNKKASLKDVPAKHITRELCLTAIKDGDCIRNVPISLLNENICIEYAKYGHSGWLSEIPKKFYTEKVAIEFALNKDNDELIYLPLRFQNEEFYLKVVKIDGYAVRKIHKKFLTLKVCVWAIANTPDAIKHLPNCLITPKLTELAENATAGKSSLLTELMTQNDFLEYQPLVTTTYEKGKKRAIEFLYLMERHKSLVNVYSDKFFHKENDQFDEDLSLFDEKYGTKYRGHLLIVYLDRRDEGTYRELEKIYPSFKINSIFSGHRPIFLLINLHSQQILSLGFGRKERVYCIEVFTSDNIEIDSPDSWAGFNKFIELDHANFTRFIFDTMDTISELLTTLNWEEEEMNDTENADFWVGIDYEVSRFHCMFPDITIEEIWTEDW